MLALRWILGAGTSLLLAGWLALFVIGSGFRRSFGASPATPLLAVLPVIVGLVLIAGALWPDRRGLCMTGLVLSALLLAGSFVLARWTPGTAVASAIVSGLWLLYFVARVRAEG